MAARRKQGADPILAQLQRLKVLFILMLLKADSPFEIAHMTGVGSSTVRRDFSAERIAPFERKTNRNSRG